VRPAEEFGWGNGLSESVWDAAYTNIEYNYYGVFEGSQKPKATKIDIIQINLP